ncbi:hypothetical protein LR48_Vigan01g015300 [Vigna angularis]|uniref:Uncharacterized protein n=1 Tax=Phaseolus angularis TaxID=3914 RepID=A0A0L9TKC0_PHAAN|nr:hypothetical protein LR48_Vigan01g015300 [Vigna angularis]
MSLLRAKSSSSVFFFAFSRTLTPLIDFQRRLASVERVVSFVYALAASASDEFLDYFLKFLLAATTTSNKTARFRACQIVFEMLSLNMPNLELRDVVNNLKVSDGSGSTLQVRAPPDSESWQQNELKNEDTDAHQMFDEWFSEEW